MNRSRAARVAFLLPLLVIAGACSQLGDGSAGDKPKVEINLLTGLPGKNNRILAAKIDDTRAALNTLPNPEPEGWRIKPVSVPIKFPNGSEEV